MSLRKKLTGNCRMGRISQRVAGYLIWSTPSNQPQSQPEFSDDIPGRLFGCLTHIIRTFDCRESPGYFPTAIMLLESLPISSDEFQLARNRIDNAQRYADADEPGAAVYELRILMGRLKRWA